jgi:hypothetical protein
MRMGLLRRVWLACICGAIALGVAAAPAQGAAGDPLFAYALPASVSPGTGFNGPCGLAVDISGSLYVSDYYHHTVDVFPPGLSPATSGPQAQIKGVAPLDGPCGLAVDFSGRLYVNAYHRDVTRYESSGFSPGPVLDSHHPTGVGVGPSETAYVNRRDRIVAYDPSGSQLEEIGLGNLGDGYGLAVSQFAATFGRVYAADAAGNTVKGYEPLLGATVPAQTIAGPPGGFGSLVDSAIAVDRVTGEIYVADRRSSPFSERPESTIQIFDATGSYRGHLKYNVIDAAPLGLAVDNSAGANQGRVYVTSGNTSGAVIYAYPPGAATTATVLPAPAAVASASEEGSAKASAAVADAERPVALALAPTTATASEVIQTGNLRLDVNGQISPQKLPRKGAAPIAVDIGWKIATADGAPPPKLKTLGIEINRAGHFDLEGLPTCPYAKIQPATTSRALANCRSTLVGRGSFSALISLAGQESYVAQGQMLVFNGLEGKKPVLFGQIYSAKPFANSFVIPFELKEIAKGRYGTSLTATLPASLRSWGSLTEIQMRLERSFGYEGKQHSFISAGCPAPKGFAEAFFPLARTSFGFVGGQSESLTLTRSCKVRG